MKAMHGDDDDGVGERLEFEFAFDCLVFDYRVFDYVFACPSSTSSLGFFRNSTERFVATGCYETVIIDWCCVFVTRARVSAVLEITLISLGMDWVALESVG